LRPSGATVALEPILPARPFRYDPVEQRQIPLAHLPGSQELREALCTFDRRGANHNSAGVAVQPVQRRGPKGERAVAACAAVLRDEVLQRSGAMRRDADGFVYSDQVRPLYQNLELLSRLVSGVYPASDFVLRNLAVNAHDGGVLLWIICRDDRLGSEAGRERDGLATAQPMFGPSAASVDANPALAKGTVKGRERHSGENASQDAVESSTLVVRSGGQFGHDTATTRYYGTGDRRVKLTTQSHAEPRRAAQSSHCIES